jgi:hypothetical protein
MPYFIEKALHENHSEKAYYKRPDYRHNLPGQIIINFKNES